MDHHADRKLTFSDLSWNGESSSVKPLEESSDDGSSLLLPLSNLSTSHCATKRQHSFEATGGASDGECVGSEMSAKELRSESNSDFEVTDLDLEKGDSDSHSKLADGSTTNLFQGSTNNLAEFEEPEVNNRPRPNTLEFVR